MLNWEQFSTAVTEAAVETISPGPCLFLPWKTWGPGYKGTPSHFMSQCSVLQFAVGETSTITWWSYIYREMAHNFLFFRLLFRLSKPHLTENKNLKSDCHKNTILRYKENPKVVDRRRSNEARNYVSWNAKYAMFILQTRFLNYILYARQMGF